MSEKPREKNTPERWLERAIKAEKRGEHLLAYDRAKHGLDLDPGRRELKYWAVLALARSGAIAQAEQEFESYGLGAFDEEDIASLRARLAKDRALLHRGDERRAGALRAALLYKAVYDRTGGYYPGINAATMSLLGGDRALAEALAREVLAKCEKLEANDFYTAATRAEAALLLNELSRAGDALRDAAANQGDNFSAAAGTRKQLRLICEHKDIDEDILAPLTPPRVGHFVGHMVDPPGRNGRFPAAAEDQIGNRIRRLLDEKRIGFGYGSLACGTDILCAEALLDRGAEVHVFLPFDREEFKQTSVVGGGPGWLDRFDRCMSRASSVVYGTDDSYMGDDALFGYAAQLAMGTALLRADDLDAEAVQVAVWDRKPAGDAPAGTAVDIEFWRGKGLPTDVIALRPAPPVAPGPAAPATSVARNERIKFTRNVRAMLFGDVKGYSRLRDHEIDKFNSVVMAALGKVMDGYGDACLYRNTWGDAIYVVLDGALPGAACALDLQLAMHDLDLKSAGLPATLSLRLGGHFGPVFDGYDFVCKEDCYFGAHVTRAARLEPVTPVGQVYVTESFAAALALERAAPFGCEYVGHLPSAKDFGRMRMYVLKDHRQPG